VNRRLQWLLFGQQSSGALGLLLHRSWEKDALTKGFIVTMSEVLIGLVTMAGVAK
jgi:hypothetical protein